jgi:hypothetical protein
MVNLAVISRFETIGTGAAAVAGITVQVMHCWPNFGKWLFDRPDIAISCGEERQVRGIQ